VVGITKAAAELGIGVATIYRWLADGFIPGEQAEPGAPWRIRLTSELRAKVTGQAPAPAAGTEPGQSGRDPARGIGQRDRHLAQFDAAEGAAVVAGGPGRVRRGLRVGGLADDQHRLAVIKVLSGPVRRELDNLPIVPDRPR
jgi:hypothetical protein